jgi:hypothetical protein
MGERFPYIRFVIDAAPVIAGVIAAIVVLGGAVSSCHQGGFGGFISFLIAVLFGAVAYVSVMVSIESLRALLDIESSTRQLLAERRQSVPPPAA